MKLLRLKIKTPFNSINKIENKDFEINFRSSFTNEENIDWNQFSPFCFAGLNGSGKSNVLEAIANIFYHLESCANVHQPNNFKLSITESFPNAYELEYYIAPNFEKDYTLKNMVKVFISKEVEEEPTMQILPYPFNDKTKPQNIETIADKASKIQAGSKSYIPDLIIGYSSGENEVLSIPFLKSRLIQFDEYKQAVLENEVYKNPESNLIYIDYEMSQAVLLSNFIFQNSNVLKPLEDELGIKDIKRFRMNLNLHSFEKGEENIGMINQYESKIKLFKACSTSFFENEHNLIIDFWVNEETKNAFKENFENIFDLFQSFQVLYTLNYKIVNDKIKSEVYQSKGYYTDGKLPTPSPSDSVFHFLDYFIEKKIGSKGETKQLLLKNLSDGEQQFLHTLGICLMLKSKSAILLLDEPETHFNPDWRSKFISTLEKSLLSSESNNLMRDILITSHSPFIISDCYPDKVIVFSKGEQPRNARDINFRTYGTSIDIIMENIFKKNNTIGDLSRGEIEAIQEEIKDLKSLTEKQVLEYKNKTNHLGDSMEKVLLFAQLNELKKI